MHQKYVISEMADTSKPKYDLSDSKNIIFLSNYSIVKKNFNRNSKCKCKS